MATKNALILIDVQNAFLDKKWGTRNNPKAEGNMKNILTACRKNEWLIIHIQHVSDSPDSLFFKDGKGVIFKENFTPLHGEKIIRKKVNSAFIGTDLDEYLNLNEIETVVIVGLTTPHCVSTTTRMSGNLGYRTFLISDGTASFELVDYNGYKIDAETIHHITLTTLHEEFATVISTQDFLEIFDRL